MKKHDNFLQEAVSFMKTSRIPKNKETLCFFVFLCFHKQTNQTLEVLSFMK